MKIINKSFTFFNESDIWEISLKYLLYHMSSEAQVKKILFCRKAIFHSQDIQVFVFLTIP